MENKRTCLYDKHVALGALISPFGGFDMPIQYSDIKDEHNAVRHACGVFDVSHMGEVTVKGPDAERYVKRQAARRDNFDALMFGFAHFHDGAFSELFFDLSQSLL